MSNNKSMLLIEFVNTVFIPNNGKVKSELTKANYRLLVEKFGRHLERTPLLSDLTNETVSGFLKAFAAAGYSRSTLVLDRQRLCSFMRCAFNGGLISESANVGVESIPASAKNTQQPKLSRKPLKDGKASLPLINFFEAHLAETKSAKTRSNYRGIINRFGRWLGFIATVDELDESIIRQFVATVSKGVRPKYRGVLFLIWREMFERRFLETVPPTKQFAHKDAPKPRSMTVLQLAERFVKSNGSNPEQTYKTRQFVNILAYTAGSEDCREVLIPPTMAKVESLTTGGEAARQGAEMFAALVEYARILGAVDDGKNEVAVPARSVAVGEKPMAVDCTAVREDCRTMELVEFYNGYYLPANPGTSPRTLSLYDYSIRKFSKHLRRSALLADLNNQTVGGYLFALVQSGSAPASCNKERAQLLSQWRHAHTLGMLTVGPLVKKIVESVEVPTALTEEQVKQLRRAAKKLQGSTAGIANGHLMRALMGVQYTTAERIGAVLKLRFDDIDGQVVTFRATTRKGRKLPIVKQVPQWVIDDIAAISRPHRELVFPIAETNATKVQALYDRLYKRAGIQRPKGKSSHLLRSTHATHVWLAGGNASESLGHSSPSITQRHYLDTRFKPDMSHLNLPDLGDVK